MKLMTSLDEIKSFNPCALGWSAVLKGRNKRQADSVLFPLSECVESNSIRDVCWLLGKRKIEIQICVSFASKCSKGAHPLKGVRDHAADYAAYAAAVVAADYAAVAAANYAEAHYAAYAAVAAADYAEAACAVAAGQKAENKQFLLDSILEWENSHV